MQVKDNGDNVDAMLRRRKAVGRSADIRQPVAQAHRATIAMLAAYKHATDVENTKVLNVSSEVSRVHMCKHTAPRSSKALSPGNAGLHDVQNARWKGKQNLTHYDRRLRE
ncbi:hypothetical protein ACJJTC_010606 [Scirpophaga incertulas]